VISHTSSLSDVKSASLLGESQSLRVYSNFSVSVVSVAVNRVAAFRELNADLDRHTGFLSLVRLVDLLVKFKAFSFVGIEMLTIETDDRAALTDNHWPGSGQVMHFKSNAITKYKLLFLKFVYNFFGPLLFLMCIKCKLRYIYER